MPNHAIGRTARCVGFIGLITACMASLGFADAAATTVASPGLFVPHQVRILDTRNGTGGYTTPMTANVARTLVVPGTAGVPTSGVSAVALTVTVVGATSVGNIAVVPGDATAFTNGSSLVYNAGDTTSNTAVVALDTTGTLKFVADHSGVNLVLDLQGYFSTAPSPTAGGYIPVAARRIVDTRTGVGVPAGKVATGDALTITPGSRINLPASAVGVYASIVVINQAGGGYVTTYATGAPPTGSFSLNFDNGDPQALGTTIPLSSAGQFDVLVAAGGPVDIVVDVEGYFDSATGAATFAAAQSRLYDSRVSPNSVLAAGETRTLTVAGTANIPLPAAGLGAVVVNLTTVNATGTTGGNLTAWTAGQPEPAVSSINFGTANSLRSALVLVVPDASGHISVHNHTSGPVHLVLDAEGWFHQPSL